MGGHSASEGGVRLLRTRDDGLGCSTYDRGLVRDGEAEPGGWTLHRSSKFGAFAWAVLFSGAGPCAAKATAAHSPEETGGRWSGGRTSCVMCASIGSECFSRSAPVSVFRIFFFSTQRGQRLLLEALNRLPGPRTPSVGARTTRTLRDIHTIPEQTTGVTWVCRGAVQGRRFCPE